MHFFNFIKENKNKVTLFFLILIAVIFFVAVYFAITEDNKLSSNSQQANVVKNKYVAYELGDANMDGKIDKEDYNLVINFTSQLKQPNNDQLVISDMNGDRKLTAADARLILILVESY